MFETLKTIKQIKRLRKKPVDREFLRLFRSDLEAFVDANPATEKAGAKWVFANLFGLKAVQVSLAAFTILILAGAGLAGASQKSLPGERLFAVKVFTEDARAAFVFNPKSQAELQAKFAAERVDEIKTILEQRGVEAPGLDVALSRLEDNSKKAEAIIDKEKEKGGDIGNDLKQKTWEGFKGGAINIKSALDTKKNELNKQEEELKIKIQAEAADSEAVEVLQNQMREIEQRQDQLMSGKNKIKSALEQSQQRMRLEIDIEFDDEEKDEGEEQGEVKGNQSGQNGGKEKKDSTRKKNGDGSGNQENNQNEEKEGNNERDSEEND